MTREQAIDLLNGRTQLPTSVKMTLDQWRSIYYAMSLHTCGICPIYKIEDQNSFFYPYGNGVLSASFSFDGGGVVSPSGYIEPEYQFLFDRKLFSRHNREAESTRNWRFSQYRPLTKAPLGQIMEVVTGAIFQDSNYSITIDDKDDTEYIWGNNFCGYNLTGYIANVAFKSIVEDPNGFTIRIPKQPFTYYQQTKSNIEVDIWFVKSKDIKYISDDEVLFFRDGYAWHVDKTTIFRYVADNNKQYSLANEDSKGYYAHMLGKLPITKAGGVWNARGWFDSYCDKALPICDDFVSTYSGAQLVDKEASHPFIVEPEVDCPECQGTGWITDGEGGNFKRHKCSPCKGMGKIAHGPGQRILAPMEKMNNNLMQIINPDISINKHHRDVVKMLMDMIIDALNLSKTEQAQSGVAKAIDQERLYKFISTISNNLFDTHIKDSIEQISAYRHMSVSGGKVMPTVVSYTIVKPTQFQIKTAQDLLQEYKDASDANLPAFVRQQMVLDYIDKQYSGDDVLKRKAQYILRYDPLSVFSTVDITTRVKSGINSKEDAVVNAMLPIWLDSVVKEMGDQRFIQATDEQIDKLVEPYETAYFAENPSASTPDESSSVTEDKQISE